MEDMLKITVLVCSIIIKVAVMVWIYDLGTSIDSSLARMAASSQQCRLQP